MTRPPHPDSLKAIAVEDVPYYATPPIVSSVADKVIKAIRRFDVGDECDLETLVEVARLTHCMINMAVGCASSYAPIDCNANVSGVIRLDATQTESELTRALAHELTHHILHWWHVPIYPFEQEQLALLGMKDEVEEMICRTVATIIQPSAVRGQKLRTAA